MLSLANNQKFVSPVNSKLNHTGSFNKERPLMDLYIFIGNHNEGILHDCKDSGSAFCLSTKSSVTSYVHVQTCTSNERPQKLH